MNNNLAYEAIHWTFSRPNAGEREPTALLAADRAVSALECG